MKCIKPRYIKYFVKRKNALDKYQKSAIHFYEYKSNSK